MSESSPSSRVLIPAHVMEKIQAQLSKSGFISAQDYVVHLLRTSLLDTDRQVAAIDSPDKDELLERLKRLGYLS